MKEQLHEQLIDEVLAIFASRKNISKGFFAQQKDVCVGVSLYLCRSVGSEILQQGDSQVSEPCHDKPVNGVAQRAGGWRTGTLLFRSARNRSFL